ncbi:MAG: Rrf2 family transcriptional regulator [Gammaproteobacteria bacterium]|nr:Rrf2 family transcriptional regulator [Gammaproteobacteria bacterium]
MKLQVSSQLAIYAVLELLAHRDRPVTVGEIGAKYGVSNHHLAKVMHVLGRAGLVNSTRGAGGGYQFSGNIRRITLLDVIDLFEQLGLPAADPGDPGAATAQGRALLQVLHEIDDIARSTLGSITLATMQKLVEQQGAPAAAAPL